MGFSFPSEIFLFLPFFGPVLIIKLLILFYIVMTILYSSSLPSFFRNFPKYKQPFFFFFPALFYKKKKKFFNKKQIFSTEKYFDFPIFVFTSLFYL